MSRAHHTLLVAVIEAGGTRFVCAVGTGPRDLRRGEFAIGDSPGRRLLVTG